MKIKDYKILRDKDPAELERLVLEHIKRNYKLLGTPFKGMEYQNENEIVCFTCQCVILEESIFEGAI
jgi:hypothetical protein